MELRLRPKNWINNNLTITFNTETLPPIIRDIKELTLSERYELYLGDFKKIFKECCNYEN